jgi:hypothetical protein
MSAFAGPGSGIAAPATTHRTAAVASPFDDGGEASAEAGERVVRAVALPAALLTAWMAVRAMPAAVRMLAMWVHETGHAVAAWVSGYLAWPGPWFTPMSQDRQWPFSLLLLSLMAFGAWRAYDTRRPRLAALAVAGIVVTLVCTVLLRQGQAQQFIVFSGDGGCLLLGTMLMLSIYVPADHPLRRDHTRWGLLGLGALAFMDALAVWSGPLGRLPFGENENGLSDASVLTEMYGWSVVALQRRYLTLACVCLGLLAAVYVAGLLERRTTIR